MLKLIVAGEIIMVIMAFIIIGLTKKWHSKLNRIKNEQETQKRFLKILSSRIALFEISAKIKPITKK